MTGIDLADLLDQRALVSVVFPDPVPPATMMFPAVGHRPSQKPFAFAAVITPGAS